MNKFDLNLVFVQNVQQSAKVLEHFMDWVFHMIGCVFERREHARQFHHATKQIARRFSQYVNESLTPEQIEDAVVKNRSKLNKLKCHICDHCDAPRLMYQAFRSFGLRPVGDRGQMDVEMKLLWNSAWSLASENGFRPRLPH